MSTHDRRPRSRFASVAYSFDRRVHCLLFTITSSLRLFDLLKLGRCLLCAPLREELCRFDFLCCCCIIKMFPPRMGDSRD